jgi:phosphatidylglycerophosphate synthase
LTSSRALLAVLVVDAVGHGRWINALAALLLGLVTDQLDGLLARKWRVTTELGRWADTVCDRLLLISPVIGMASFGDIPWWLANVLTAWLVLSDYTAWPADSYKFDQLRPVDQRHGVLPPSKVESVQEVAFRSVWFVIYGVTAWGVWHHLAWPAAVTTLVVAAVAGVAVLKLNEREIARVRANLSRS